MQKQMSADNVDDYLAVRVFWGRAMGGVWGGTRSIRAQQTLWSGGPNRINGIKRALPLCFTRIGDGVVASRNLQVPQTMAGVAYRGGGGKRNVASQVATAGRNGLATQ